MAAFAPTENAAVVLRAAEAVDWSRLRHLRGPAIDVPALLRGVASDDVEARRGALVTLGTRILPFYDGIDGAVCEVTSHVVPFLARLAAADVRGAADVLVLLRRIATVAWDRDPYPRAEARRPLLATAVGDVARRVLAPPSAPRAQSGRLARALGFVRGASSALYRHFDPMTAELLYGHRTHVALCRELPIAFQLLGHPHAEIRTEAARLVERLAQSAARPADLSLRIVKSLENANDEIVVSHLVLGLGYVGDGPARTLLEALLDANDPLVRVLAAVALPDPESPEASPPKRLSVLVSALATPDPTFRERYELATSRVLTNDVKAALTARPADAAPAATHLLTVLAERAERELPESFFEVLLDLVFPDAPAPVSPMSLTRDQRLVLRRLAEVTERSRGERDLSQRLVAKGLPADPRGLARFYALN